MGSGFKKLHLPLISGFIFCGILAGPHVLGLMDETSARYTHIVDSLVLPFIAFIAGSELHLDELVLRINKFLIIMSTLIAVVLVLGTLCFMYLSSDLPFMMNLSFAERLSVSLLGASILVAKSPSSAIAVIKELRAKGPFTQTALGVTVLMDAAVITIFAICSGLLMATSAGKDFEIPLLLYLALSVGAHFLFGLLIAKALSFILSRALNANIKTALIILVGYLVFSVYPYVHELHVHGVIPAGIFYEPLLACMVAGFIVANYSEGNVEFVELLEQASGVLFLVFFTALGVGLELRSLQTAWMAVFVLIIVRFSAIYLGAFLGGTLAGDPFKNNRYLGLGMITQAGVSLGLAKEVGLQFSFLGEQFSTLFVAVIVCNTVIGPALFKLALFRMGEAHSRYTGNTHENLFVVIFGVESQSILLAKQLTREDFHVLLLDRCQENIDQFGEEDLDIQWVESYSPETLEVLGVRNAQTIVMMHDNETNYKVCEIAYESFGIDHLVVRYQGGEIPYAQFQELGASMVDSNSAMIASLEAYVRSPSTASLFFGKDVSRDIIEIEVQNKDLQGIALRNLHLPTDLLILGIRRKGELVLTHGYNRLRVGDEITVVGNPESLDEMVRRCSRQHSDRLVME